MVRQAQGCPERGQMIWDRDGTLEMDREKEGLFITAREYEAEGRHQPQNSLLAFRKISFFAGQNCSLSSSACAATRAEGLLRQQQENCELPHCAHPLLLRVSLSQMPAQGPPGPQQRRKPLLKGGLDKPGGSFITSSEL